jgi:hypothetical protein
LRELHSSHTLGDTGNWNTFHVSPVVVKILQLCLTNFLLRTIPSRIKKSLNLNLDRY